MRHWARAGWSSFGGHARQIASPDGHGRNRVSQKVSRNTALLSSIARLARPRLPSATMLSSRAQPAMTLPRHRAPVWLLVISALASLLLLGNAAKAHEHGHRHAPPVRADAARHAHVHENPADTASPGDEEHGHHHSGDPLKDLLTLGHNHVSSACPGLPPTSWILAAAPNAAQPVVPWPERLLVDSPPDSPFRPPIT